MSYAENIPDNIPELLVPVNHRMAEHVPGWPPPSYAKQYHVVQLLLLLTVEVINHFITVN